MIRTASHQKPMEAERLITPTIFLEERKPLFTPTAPLLQKAMTAATGCSVFQETM